MKKFRNVPAVITLLAGFISSVVMILQGYELVDFLWMLVCIMVGFYVAGLLVRVILNKFFKDLEEPEEETEKTEEAADGEDGASAEAEKDIDNQQEG
jgi:flagellar biosynthesis/type III secretory pathway M-ring protein FliF/YscJ